MDKLPFKQRGEKQAQTKTHTSYDKEALKTFSDSELTELHNFLKTDGNRNSRRLVECEMKRRKKNSGFTLLELLIALTIAAIIGALVIPFFERHPLTNTRQELAEMPTEAIKTDIISKFRVVDKYIANSHGNIFFYLELETETETENMLIRTSQLDFIRCRRGIRPVNSFIKNSSIFDGEIKSYKLVE